MLNSTLNPKMDNSLRFPRFLLRRCYDDSKRIHKRFEIDLEN